MITRPLEARRADDAATQRLEGDLPDGVTDLHHQFTLRNNFVVRLAIEP
ncbi:hypothetical protein [Streptomyces fagopyri]